MPSPSHAAAADLPRVHDGLFRGGPDGSVHLVGGACHACGRAHFPRSQTCPWCSAGDTGETLLPASGTLWAWTAVTAAPPGYSGDVPYGFGVVELTGSLRVITRLTEPDPAKLSFGQPMTMVLVPLPTAERGEVATYAFAPSAQSQPTPAELP